MKQLTINFSHYVKNLSNNDYLCAFIWRLDETENTIWDLATWWYLNWNFQWSISNTYTLITNRMFVITCIENKFSFWLFFQELTEENRVLNRLVKRQGVVLDRLASNNGELPTLLYAHNEEIRVTRQRMKQVRTMKSRCLLSFFSLPSTY